MRQVDRSLSPRARLIVALDFDNRADAFRLVDALGDHVVFYKVGMELLVSEGPQVLRELKNRRKQVFLDIKFGDIDETVERTIRSVARLGIDLLTLHGAAATAQAARRGRGENGRPKLLSLTYLSSLDQTDLTELLSSEGVTLADHIRRRAVQSLRAGCDGLIASGESVADLRDYLQNEHGLFPILVAPGIRPAGASSNDHKRTLTPGQAMKAGADYIVVGRPIRNADDCVTVADAIVREMEEALQEENLNEPA